MVHTTSLTRERVFRTQLDPVWLSFITAVVVVVVVYCPRQLSGAPHVHLVRWSAVVPAPGLPPQALPPAARYHVYTTHGHCLCFPSIFQGKDNVKPAFVSPEECVAEIASQNHIPSTLISVLQ